MRGLTAACLALGLALAAGLPALEKANPELQRARQTSTLKEISLRPIFVYSARGRRDPFTLDISQNTSTASASRGFSIAGLVLNGFIGSGEGRIALFRNVFKGTTFKLRGGRLFSSESAVIADVKGSIRGDQVTLVQGESNIVFTLNRNARIESLEATIAQDRKELQR